MYNHVEYFTVCQIILEKIIIVCKVQKENSTKSTAYTLFSYWLFLNLPACMARGNI